MSDLDDRQSAWKPLHAYLTVCVLAAVVALPALRGDFAAYLDNPVHLAEIRSLARADSHGWVSFGFCGFPLDVLQSPLLYGLSQRLVRLGLRLEPIYALISVLGLLAPALAVLHVTARRVDLRWATLLSCSVLLYRGSLVGSAATLGGMFGFHLASAAWVLLLDKLSHRERNLRDVAVTAALAAFIGLTHMYVTIALVYLAIAHAIWTVVGKRNLKLLLIDALGLGLGAVGAAAYWLPNLLARTAVAANPDSFARILSRLVITSAPQAPPGVHGVGRVLADPVLFLDALPQLFVLVLAAWSLTRALRDEDPAPRYALSIAAVFLFLMATQPFTHLPLLGPQGERQIYLVKLSLVLVAMPAAKAWSFDRQPSFRWLASFAALLLFAGASARVVKAESVPDPELGTLRSVWQRLRSLPKDEVARIYVQGSIAVPAQGALSRSHVMVQTSERTGLEQMGAYYGNTPYEREWMYIAPLASATVPADASTLDATLVMMERGNVSHLLLTNPDLFPLFQADSRFHSVFREGAFLVLARNGAKPVWAEATAGEGPVELERLGPGSLRLRVGAGVRSLQIKEAFHPFWRASPATDIHPDDSGFMRLEAPPPGVIELKYLPPRAPVAISWLSCLTILALFLTSFAKPVAKRRLAAA